MHTIEDFPKPLLGFAAYSGVGKTTLLEKLIPILVEQGLRVALIKHSHHDIDLDKPGKDSYRLRKAGATQVVLAGTQRSILFSEYAQKHDSKLSEQLALLQTDTLDLVLVEGFRDQPFSKIELHRSDLAKPFLFTSDASIIAVACDGQVPNCRLPLLDLNNVEMLAQFVCQFVHS
ncbi:molybdopterin-guanine dinucleotide biosynthesis protein B [Psychromonas sp. MME1]